LQRGCGVRARALGDGHAHNAGMRVTTQRLCARVCVCVCVCV
jgi:hypothetical protein